MNNNDVLNWKYVFHLDDKEPKKIEFLMFNCFLLFHFLVLVVVYEFTDIKDGLFCVFRLAKTISVVSLLWIMNDEQCKWFSSIFIGEENKW